jgi:hypothetical protein
MRGLDKVKFIMSDESDYYPPFQQREVRAVMEGYIGKPNSDPTIIICSTPRAPGGLLQEIELEQNSLYYKLFLTYEYGLEDPNPIYSKEQIEKAKQSPDFRREFAGEYLGLIGNTFSTLALTNCIRLGQEMANVGIDPGSKKVLAIDPAFGGGSNFAIVGLQYINGKIQVIHASEYSRPNINDMLDVVWNLKKEWGNISNIYVDSSAPVYWQPLKQSFSERHDEQHMKNTVAMCKEYNIPIEEKMFIVPLNFQQLHKQLLQHCKWITEEVDDHDGKALVAIDPQKYDKLLTALRTAVSIENSLQKDQTSYHDILDCYRMCTYYFKRRSAQ